MDPEDFSYQRDSPHANAVEVPDSLQAGILLSAVESFQKNRYPDAGTSPTIFHSENYWDGAAIVLGAITCPHYIMRYLIIYSWRIMEGQVPSISEPNKGGINEKWHIRRGRVCIVPTVNSQSSGSLRSLYYTSLAIHGPRLFNSVPATIRNMNDCSVDTFKRCLDKYLGMVPDEPHISRYTALRRAESNSLFDMALFASAQLVSTLEEPDLVSVARGGHPWPSCD